MSGPASGPWGAVPEATPPKPVSINATDFLSAQRANRRNTWLLILILLLLGGTIGYLGGALIESYSQPYGGGVETLSAFGVIGGGGLIAIGLGASAVTFAFGDRVILGLAGAREADIDSEPMLHNVVE